MRIQKLYSSPLITWAKQIYLFSEILTLATRLEVHMRIRSPVKHLRWSILKK